MVPQFAVAGGVEEQEGRLVAGGGVGFGAVAVGGGFGGGWQGAQGSRWGGGGVGGSWRAVGELRRRTCVSVF